MNNCKVCGIECKRIFCSVSCSNVHRNIIRRQTNIKTTRKVDEVVNYTGICKKCGNSFTVSRERKKLYGKNIPSYCSRACSNSHTHSDEVKNKIRNSILRTYENIPSKTHKKMTKNNKIKEDRFCRQCGKVILGVNAKSFCSQECSSTNSHEIVQNLIIAKLLSNENVKGHSIPALKNAITKLNGPKCSICGVEEWMGEPVPLVMDHINGRAKDHRYENLRLVCPICDRRLPTFGSKNKNSDRANRRKT